jgi:hypothetical protein
MGAMCWWCGAPADSREHKFKRTDITRIFGQGPYYGGRTLLRHSEGRNTEMRGAQSPVLKFSPTMCRYCNNVRSKPFDNAYDTFITYIDAHAHSILAANQISLSRVYGANWKTGRDNLLRFYVKHICCRLAEPTNEYQIDINPQLIAFLDGGPEPECLELDLYTERSYLRMWRIFELADDPITSRPGSSASGPSVRSLNRRRARSADRIRQSVTAGYGLRGALTLPLDSSTHSREKSSHSAEPRMRRGTSKGH